MSTRQLLSRATMTGSTGVLTVLTILALGGVAATWNADTGGDEAAGLALRQQALIADMGGNLDDLAAADDFASVNRARGRLARTIVAFDQTLTALTHGGTVPGENGRPVTVAAVAGQDARRALADASALWLQVGLPLADLAAGEFSVFSAAGQSAMTGLRSADAELTSYMAAVSADLAGGAPGHRHAALASRVAAGLLLLALAVVVHRRRNRSQADDPAAAGATGPAAPAAPPVSPLAPQGATPPSPAIAGLPDPAAARPAAPYAPHLDFENVSAAVDRMTVDMSTIATSTEKMRLAIGQVGTALHGMLYNLDDLSRDTAEGYRVVRGANNAASYTAEVARALADSVREMDAVVAQVAQLATRTRQTAAQIDAEASQTGGTSPRFTDAVSQQVKGLAGQTAQATAEIEHTISEMLSRTRDYEEAIGHIVKHVSAIHKVSRSFGEMALDPPASAVVGPPQPRRPLEPVAAPAPVAAAVPEAPAEPAPAPMVEEPAEVAEATPEQVVAETADAIAEAAAPATEAVDLGPEPTDDDPEMDVYNKPQVAFSLDDDPAAAADEPAAIEEPAAATEPAKPAVFMLNRPEDAQEEEPAAVETEDPAAAGPAPEPPAPEPAPVAQAAPESAPAVAEGDTPNIFMLNVPAEKIQPGAAEDVETAEAAETPEATAPAAEAEPVPAADPEPAAAETAPEPADDGPCLQEGDTPDVFMIYAPRAAAEMADATGETVATS